MSKLKTKRNISRFLGSCTFLSLFLPILFCRNNGHDCRYDGHDDCMKIFYKEQSGCCVQDCMNDLGLFLAVVWWFVIVEGAMTVSKDKSATSPYIIMAIWFACGVLCAMLDPSKWPLVIATLLSATLFVVCTIVDGKKEKE